MEPPLGRTITAAIPAVFEAYATVVVAYGEERDAHDRALLALLRRAVAGPAVVAGVSRHRRR